MNMKLLLIVMLISSSRGMFCNQFPLDEIACIQKTEGISCIFNFFENGCVETQSTSSGCIPNLNKKACLQQQTSYDGTEAKCYFSTKCMKANAFHLKNLSCDHNFSIYACLNVKSQQCQWMNNRCIAVVDKNNKQDNCNQVYLTPVSPWLCSQIQELKCYNNGFLGGYTCSDVSDQQLTQFQCDTLGLSEMGCVSIITSNQKCIFQNNTCQLYSDQYIDSCEASLNRELCLSITDPHLLCQWTNKGCITLEAIIISECGDLINVNPSVCRMGNGLCQYDDNNFKCKQLSNSVKIGCNSEGLSEEACLGVQSEKCIYFSGQCRTVSDEELHLFNCEQAFNELACINVTTPFQFCKWSENKCKAIFINQETECLSQQDPLNPFKDNGNICKAISKQNQGCKYNSKINLCELSSLTDTCTTLYLNLYGCVQVQSSAACRWNTDTFQCEDAKIVDQLTKCEDLGFANPVACSQIAEPIVMTNGKKTAFGCYYNSDIQSCKYTNDAVLKTMECTQPGLNKYGCTQIVKIGQRCRWVRGNCITITKREYVASILCLDLQFVNPGTCSLASANQEVCKYSQDAFGCVNTINSSSNGDSCSSPGLNSYGCAQITRNLQGCYFDKINNLCILAPDGSSSDEATQLASEQLLSTAKCVASSPTLNICIAIQTLGELCSWSSRSNSCGYQYVTFNEKCLDYNTIEKQKTVPSASVNVNANVCASIVMNFPDYDPKATLKTTDALRGYCQFDGKGNCIIYQQKPCTDNCCTNIPGINAHVCSRYTNQAVYCYFNEYNNCLELTNDDTDKDNEKSVKAFYNYKQYKCSSMNFKSCTMIEWSTKQQCYWNGYVCTQINYNDYPNFLTAFPGTKLSKYGCLGIEANKTNVEKYFRFIADTKTCAIDPLPISCNESVNMNKCLGHTPDIYCYWDKLNLQCLAIDDYLSFQTCNEYQNKKACIDNPYVPCLFLDGADKCIPSPQEVNCTDFSTLSNDYYGWVNEKACANITKAGQICKFLGNICVVSNNISSNCELPGINSIGCYARTSGNCRWDQTKLLCYEVDASTIQILKCTDNVNKELCLQIVTQPCEWVTLDMQCILKVSLISVVLTNQYNPQTCTQMTGAPYYFDSTTFLCKELTTDNNGCSSKIMNQQACLLKTKGFKCYFDSTLSPENKCSQFKEEQEICQSTLLVNIEICMNIPQVCYFDESDMLCKASKLNTSIKCSSLISSTIHYNKLSCSSISDTVVDSSQDASLKVCTSSPSVAQAAQQCYFEKYCFWSESVYGCQLNKILNASYSPGGQNSSATCSLSAVKVDCQPIYTSALCLQFGNNCFFDITQGGCKSYSDNLFKPTDCSQINGGSCTKSKTTTAYCKEVTIESGGDLTPSCELDPPVTSTCTNDSSFAKSSCSSLSSSSTAADCAQASDDCYLSTTCSTPTSKDGLICATPGISQSLCLQLSPACDFSSGKCTPLTIPTLDSNKYNYYYVCNEVNLLTTKTSSVACAKITTSPCKYSGQSCVNAFYQQCSSLSGFIVSQPACNQCKGATASYDPDTYLCLIVTNLATPSCDQIADITTCQGLATKCQWDSENKLCHINLSRVNQLSCLQLTSNIASKWNSDMNQCVALSASEASQETDCSVQSIKSCFLIKNSCWISNTLNQCQEINQISKGCSDINTAKGIQNQCLISVSEACKWSNNQCVSADLNVDVCSVLNKYGCLHKNNVTCGWSDNDDNCKSINLQNNQGCSKYVSGGDKNYFQVNPYSCGLILQGNCFWNSTTNQCVSVGNSIISCNTHSGINQSACIQQTIGKCKYDTGVKSCIPITNSDSTCSPLLNQEACLSLNYCQFYNNQCQDFPYKSKTTIALASSIPANSAVISPYICTYYNNQILNAFFIYDSGRGYCLNANKAIPNLFIATCQSIGINEKICKQKTKDYCQYSNSQCTSLSLTTINQETTCNNAYNWYSCIKLQSNCKFQLGQCVTLLPNDTCVTLSAATVFVGPKICAQMNSACKYNSDSYNCQAINDILQLCSAVGISKMGCLSNTSKSFCYFDAVNFLCSDNYDRSLSCSDVITPKTWYINTNLCYFIKSLGSYCQFDKGECSSLTESQISTCNPATPTNSRTCSKAQDTILCFYNPANNKCSSDPVFLQNQSWYDSNSFNKLACINYASTSDVRKTIWDDIQGCIELTTKDLGNIQCNSPINKLACVSITNPTQFCQFDDLTKKCSGFDYTIPPTNKIGSCGSLTNVNRFEFCQYAPDSCQYNAGTKHCVAGSVTNAQIINPSDCFDKGLSEVICVTLTQCKYSSERKLCYGGNIFCTNNTPLTCNSVKSEPCWIHNGICTGISYADLTNVNCGDVVNVIGCTSISNPSTVCQFDTSNKVCKELKIFNNNCSSYQNVNSGKACEQTIDVACRFDFKSKGCKEVSSTDIYECDRGLNQLACTSNTRSSLYCKFNKFCYGPTFGIIQCSDILNKNTCLNHTLLCTWDDLNQSCLAFTLTGQLCQDLETNKNIVSSQVCYNSKADGGACVYDINKYVCKFIIPQACQELETKQQCISQFNLPCIWGNDRCSFITLVNTDHCSTIGSNGSQRACMDVFRQGELCQYINNSCSAFVEQVDSSKSNCLDSLNIIACVQQQRSKCQWKVITKSVMITLTDSIQYSSGVCSDYVPNPQQNCDSTLSYLSCFTIIKQGQFCRWLNGQCLSIPPQVSTVKIYYNTYQLVNQNSCGLVNVNKVRYQKLTRSCSIIGANEILTCKCGQETIGLNKYACLSIKTENCQWLDSFKRCVEYKSKCYPLSNTRLLTLKEDSVCFIQNATVADCQRLEYRLPCGFEDGNCTLIDLTNTGCKTPGLNQFACENIASKTCYWDDEEKQCTQEKSFLSQIENF